MSGFAEMLRGMLAGRRIAAADVAADQTFAQLHPALAGFKAFGATVVARLNLGICL
jgi:hypothetical protein